jgi:hypothetical protein
MSFRRSKKSVLDVRRWRTFVNENRSQFNATGMPEYVYQTEEIFDEFLMHGCLGYYHRPYDFTVEELTREQAVELREIIVKYLASGFGDPGLCVFSHEEHEAIRAEARNRSEKFQ